jgi:hypothetical protein
MTAIANAVRVYYAEHNKWPGGLINDSVGIKLDPDEVNTDNKLAKDLKTYLDTIPKPQQGTDKFFWVRISAGKVEVKVGGAASPF